MPRRSVRARIPMKTRNMTPRRGMAMEWDHTAMVARTALADSHSRRWFPPSERLRDASEPMRYETAAESG